MPRIGRVILPNYPHHVVQRGHNRQVVFVEESDYRYYLDTLEAFKQVYDVKVFGFCLMTNHVHLILQPGEAVADLGQLMKRLAGRQTRFVNRQESRSGTLWEGRYKSSPIDTDAYLLACCRYVELNPVRAGMTDSPASYPWSSYRWHTRESADDGWLDVDPCYVALGSTAEERALRYREFVRGAIPEAEWRLIRDALQRGQLTGSERFTDQVEVMINRRIEKPQRGRPRRVSFDDEPN
ncbi:transposase [Thiocystis violascens]|uniref:Transposase n=1 Tax=Thiocystis violascens (strain ATCC 17096 / DSM 198 / 6111) TaxID=765911 RepID=I3Y8F2_THIV6|nr:transposase [Thiocystis violascens]AFL73270.1 transposase [Thiocystis violascens DSM 198]